MVVIRLKRIGAKNKPCYRVSVADSRKAVKGRFLDNLGHYNSLNKKLILNKERYEHWLKHGAKPSLTIKNLYKKHCSGE